MSYLCSRIGEIFRKELMFKNLSVHVQNNKNLNLNPTTEKFAIYEDHSNLKLTKNNQILT